MPCPSLADQTACGPLLLYVLLHNEGEVFGRICMRVAQFINIQEPPLVAGCWLLGSRVTIHALPDIRGQRGCSFNDAELMQ